MNHQAIIESLNTEISNLQQARAILAKKPPQRETKVKRVMSADARARIAAAQKKRWAKQKAA